MYESDKMREVLTKIQVKLYGTADWTFQTEKLVLEGIGFQCDMILPWLIKRMPKLTHILLQVS